MVAATGEGSAVLSFVMCAFFYDVVAVTMSKRYAQHKNKHNKKKLVSMFCYFVLLAFAMVLSSL